MCLLQKITTTINLKDFNPRFNIYTFLGLSIWFRKTQQVFFYRIYTTYFESLIKIGWNFFLSDPQVYN